MHSIIDFAAVIGELMDRLGDNVASKLMKMDIRGQKGNPQNCPIARLLRRELEQYNIDSVSVNGQHLIGFREGVRVFELTPTSAVSQFIRDFDNGKYPELFEEAIPALNS